MIRRKIREFFRPEGLEEAKTPQKKKAIFMVSYEGKLIGTLELEDGVWKFSYSDRFKEERFIAPLFDFPEVNKVYASEELWPFFAGRIPGLKQPEVEETIEHEEIDKTDLIALLTRFGKRTITNPFVVERKRLVMPT